MTEERNEQRPEGQQAAPWTKLFGAFRQALDPKCLLLAAAGLLVMSAGWWVLAWLFYSLRSMPEWSRYAPTQAEALPEAWREFEAARKAWNLLHALAGPAPSRLEEAKKYEPADVASSFAEFQELEAIASAFQEGKGDKKRQEILTGKDDKKRQVLAKYEQELARARLKPFGLLATWPWFEYRGPNPFLVVTGGAENRATTLEQGRVLDWLIHDQAPVLLEPLVKFLLPIWYLLDAEADWYLQVYLALVLLWTLASWGFFGGAITRIVAVGAAKPGAKVSLREALRFARGRFLSFFFAPLVPLLILLILALFLLIPFGLCQFVPILGDIVAAGLFWWVVLLAGLVMACLLVGLVGWPLMYPAISAEGSDAFDAFSRTYSYLYQAPLQFLWYGAVALCYGAVLVFFVGFMGSLLVYLGKWSVAQMPYLASKKVDRDPAYYFVHAPTSFGWRNLGLRGYRHAEPDLVIDNRGNLRTTYRLSDDYLKEFKLYNQIGAIMVSVWLYLLFLIVVGFGYSYFFAAGTLIYLLIRYQVDETELDEVYLEETEEEPLPQVFSAWSSGPADEPKGQVTMVEAPTLRPSVPATPAATVGSDHAPPAPEPAATPLSGPTGDGEPPAAADSASPSTKPF